MASAISRLAILATAPIVACASLALAPMAHAVGAGQGDSAPGQAIVRDGSSAATAAASCWDIKQRNPGAADGAYWLQTPAMDHPSSFVTRRQTVAAGS